MIQNVYFWVYVQINWSWDLRDVCTTMFIAAFFTITKIWKQTNCPFTDEWINKIWSKFTMEYHSTPKEGKTATGNHMDNLGGQYAKWYEPVTEEQTVMFPLVWGIWNRQ